MEAQQSSARFPLSMRILHWLLAGLLLGMLFIGAAMVTSLLDYHRLLALARPLGIAILVLAIVRLVNRKRSTLPPFPATMSERERRIASASEALFYALMIGLPLVGWAMLSAGSYRSCSVAPCTCQPFCPRTRRCTRCCAVHTPSLLTSCS